MAFLQFPNITKTNSPDIGHKETNANNNPFDGPTTKDVVVVDSKGNAIPVKAGETIQGSSDGKFLQVRNNEGKPTGLRKDGPHRPHKHNDPRALAPHCHVPGTSKGQITVPKEIRVKAMIHEGTQLDFQYLENGTILIIPIQRHISQLKGIVRSKRKKAVSLSEMKKAISDAAQEAMS